MCDLELNYRTLAVMDNVYAKVPDGYRPAHPMTNMPGEVADGSAFHPCLISVGTDGYVKINSAGVLANQVFANLVWLA